MNKWIDGFFVVPITKAHLVFTREEFKTALRRGKWWRRHKSLSERLEKIAGGRDDPMST